MAQFTLENLEYMLVILARTSAFIFVAPIFSLRNVPQRAKVFLSVGITIILYFSVPFKELQYSGVIEYGIIVIKEAICGLILGLFAALALYILTMAGQMVDIEIGLSNIQEYDPSSNITSTISSSFLNYGVCLILIATNMHLFILKAAIDSYDVIPVGGVQIDKNIFSVMLGVIGDYMIIAFRIVLPIFAAILLVNTLLAILAKVAPQMNMFVIGFQIKIFVGLTVMSVMMLFLRSISDLIFNKMMEYMRESIPYMHG